MVKMKFVNNFCFSNFLLLKKYPCYNYNYLNKCLILNNIKDKILILFSLFIIIIIVNSATTFSVATIFFHVGI